MSVAVIRALLVADAAVLVLCPATKIAAGVIPQGTAMPAISITHVGTVPVGHIDAQAEFSLVVSRVQITVMAADYPGATLLTKAARKACNYERGTIAGVSVVSVVRDTVGPDFTNDDASIYCQTIDFKVTHHEQN